MTNDEQRSAPPRLTSINIKGFKCFRDFSASFEPLEVFVGANGTGKTSLFEFIRFLREGSIKQIPPEVIYTAPSQQVFYSPGPEKFHWLLEFSFPKGIPLIYEGELIGPKGRIQVLNEQIKNRGDNFLFLTFHPGQGMMFKEPGLAGIHHISKSFRNELSLFYMIDAKFKTSFSIANSVKRWRCYSSFSIDREKLRRSLPIEQDAQLNENFSNLSSVFFVLFTEHIHVFNELKRNIKLVVPGFHDLSIKARGGPGEVMAMWEEGDKRTELTLADLSDGVLNLLCWITLCLHPDPPPLVCIDEPEVGVHPRALPLLAGLFQKLSERTQVFIATHSSYLLSQFPVENVTVMKKEGGEVVARKVKDSKALMANLDEFGPEELEAMHQSDELEALS